jgi:hypothetical protein
MSLPEGLDVKHDKVDDVAHLNTLGLDNPWIVVKCPNNRIDGKLKPALNEDFRLGTVEHCEEHIQCDKPDRLPVDNCSFGGKKLGTYFRKDETTRQYIGFESSMCSILTIRVPLRVRFDQNKVCITLSLKDIFLNTKFLPGFK